MKKHVTAEEACMEYARIAQLIREESAKISPWNCERAAIPEVKAAWPGPTTPIEPCISTLFQKRDPGDNYEEHRDWQEEFEDEMCDACKECLKHVRERRKLRLQMGVAKRRVTAIGKRIIKEQV